MIAPIDKVHTIRDQSLVLELGSERFEIHGWCRDCESSLLLDGWHFFRHGDVDGMLCSDDGLAENGSSSIQAELEKFGFFMPHDVGAIFQELFKDLVISGPDKSSWNQVSERLTLLIEETTQAHQRFEQS